MHFRKPHQKKAAAVSFSLLVGLLLASSVTPLTDNMAGTRSMRGDPPAGSAVAAMQKADVPFVDESLPEMSEMPALNRSADGATFQVTWADQGTGVSHPGEAETAFAFAADIWGSFIQSAVPIKVSVIWTNAMPCSGIGCANPTTYSMNFDNAPLVDTYYAIALANALAGTDLAPEVGDMTIHFDADEDWSFTTERGPAGTVDFVTIALHEMAHGLGFLGNMYESYNVGFCGNGPYYWYECPTPYDFFAEDSSGIKLLSYLDSNPITLGSRLKSDARFGGPNTVDRNSGSAKLYTPQNWEQGSSLSHLEPGVYQGTENALMLPSYSAFLRSPGPVTLAMMQDLGWVLADGTPNLTAAAPLAVGLGENAELDVDLAWPDYAGQAITYAWSGTGQTAASHTVSAAADSLTWSWNSTGVKALEVTATGASEPASVSGSLLVFDVDASGLANGDTNASYTFFANLAPSETNLPVDYSWQATGQTPVQHTEMGTTDSVVFNWSTPGLQIITVTATIDGSPVTATHQIQIERLVFDVELSGPAQGDTNLNYTFFANITPSNILLPVDYAWQATGQNPIQHIGQGTTDSVVFSWPSPGTQTITVTATIDGSPVTETHQIQIEGLVFDHFVYLPAVIRQ